MALSVALVVERDQDAAVQKRKLTQPLRKRVEAEGRRLEYVRVRFECDFRSAPLGRAGDGDLLRWLSSLVTLLIDLAVPPDLEIQGFRQGVHHGHADAVQPTRYLVALVVELAARVENRQHHFGRRFTARVAIDRNAAA